LFAGSWFLTLHPLPFTLHQGKSMTDQQRTKVLALLSGGLDSTLAVKLMQEQGFDITAVNFVTPFCTCNRKGRCEARHVAEKFDLPLKVIMVSEEYINIIRNPKFGHGRNMNPCLDCRIFMFRQAKKMMEEIGAAFIITGEVLGQRPMSQRRDAMRLIDREAGLEGKVLRPLSAKLLPSTEMEGELVDREKMLDIQGRSRKPQMELAAQLGVDDYACAAGGCLLTDLEFAKRVRDLLAHSDNVTLRDMELLKIGRHFRLSPQAKAIVGRDESENERLLKFAKDQDIIFRATDFPGPLVLLQSQPTPELLTQTASLAARYSDGKDQPQVNVVCNRPGEPEETLSSLAICPAQDDWLAQVRI